MDTSATLHITGQEELDCLMQMLEGTGVGVWHWQLVTGQLTATAPWFQMLGLAPVQVAPSIEEWQRLCHPEDLPQVQRLVEQLRRGEIPLYRFEHRLKHTDGRWIWVLGQAVISERDRDGVPIALMGSNVDITAEKASHLQLLHSEALLRESQQTSQVGSWEYDAIKSRIWWSAETYRLFGSDPSKDPPDFQTHSLQIHPDDREYWKNVVNKALKEGRPYEMEFRILLPWGECRTVLGKGRCELDTRGNVTRMSGTVQDISARKMMENELRNSKQVAEDATKAKSKFLAAMSHEVRTPLSGIMGLTELLAESALSSEQQDTVSTILFSARTLKVILDDILDLSKMESKKLAVAEGSFKIRELVNNIHGLFASRLRDKKVDMIVEINKAIPEWIISDESRISQILWNLLSNAIKFTPQQGEILIFADIEKETHLSSPRLVLSVIDNGIGISKEALNRIFNPFEQAEESTTRQYGGTGLGLTISKQLAQLLGGDLSVDSRVEVGTIFSFHFPLRQGSERVAAPTIDLSMPHPLASGKRVLVAEDNEVNQKLITRMLQKLGCEVDVAIDGDKAVVAYQAQASQYDFVLMDCQMPLCDGFEATRRIRALQGKLGIRVPIIALTAYALEEDRLKCLEAGMDSHLTKPFNRLDFVKILEKWAH